MSTIHNSGKIKEIAKTVIMPGDPLRAKFIAETFLTDSICYTSVRNVLGYTGSYKGVPVSIQASGMGCPSMGIYSYELFSHYDVDTIIRVGSAGAFSKRLPIGSLILAQSIATDSNYALQYQLPGYFTPTADFSLLEQTVQVCRDNKFNFQVGTVLCSDIFYNDRDSYIELWKKMAVLCIEMESMALYCNAIRLKKQALSLLTISDNLETGEDMSIKEREKSFTQMITTALDTVIKITS